MREDAGILHLVQHHARLEHLPECAQPRRASAQLRQPLLCALEGLDAPRDGRHIARILRAQRGERRQPREKLAARGRDMRTDGACDVPRERQRLVDERLGHEGAAVL